MGRSRTPAYRVEIVAKKPTIHHTPMAWKMKIYGAANEGNLAKVVAKYNESFQPGGVNEQCGVDSTIVHAELIRQQDGHVVARYVDVEAVEALIEERSAA